MQDAVSKRVEGQHNTAATARRVRVSSPYLTSGWLVAYAAGLATWVLIGVVLGWRGLVVAGGVCAFLLLVAIGAMTNNGGRS